MHLTLTAVRFALCWFSEIKPRDLSVWFAQNGLRLPRKKHTRSLAATPPLLRSDSAVAATEDMNPETLSLPPSASSASNSPTASTAAAGASTAPSAASGGTPMAASKDTKDSKEPPETKGWLYKWTNYIKGYQKRWFVLANGLLSYYRNQAEMAHTCRGTISLHGAHIHTEDSCNFIVSNGGGTQTFHLRASSEVRYVPTLQSRALFSKQKLHKMINI